MMYTIKHNLYPLAIARFFMRISQRFPLLSVAGAVLLWLLLYMHVAEIASVIVATFPVDQQGHMADSLRFLLYEAPKVLLLLTIVVMVMGMINSWFTAERTRAILSGRHEGVGNMLAALLGVVTPFCSCSAVPLFIGFIKAGVPPGVTFSFLIAAPMVNEVALTMLFALVGWKVACLYAGLGLVIAMVAGWVIGRLQVDEYLEDWVRDMANIDPAFRSVRLSLAERLHIGMQSVRDIVGRVWLYVVIGVAVGAAIHGYVPEDFMAALMGQNAPWWSVPAAILVGVPMCSNAAGMIPVVEALLAKGAALGTVLAFMMSVIALSLPEMVILRKVLKPQLIALFIAVVSSGILVVGIVFNAVGSRLAGRSV